MVNERGQEMLEVVWINDTLCIYKALAFVSPGNLHAPLEQWYVGERIGQWWFTWPTSGHSNPFNAIQYAKAERKLA